MYLHIVTLVKPAARGSDVLPHLPCACASLRRAARAVTQLYGEELRRTGLTPAQFTLLQVLARTDSITQGRLGDVLALDSTTLSRTLKPLEAKRWIRSRPGEDRRERHLELAPAGRAQIEWAAPFWERAQRRLRSRLGAEGWQGLLAALSRATVAARER